MNKMEAVQKVNSLFEYQFDKDQYNVADYWRVLDVNAEKDQGDCEDYALTVGWLLAGQSRLKFTWMILTKKIKIQNTKKSLTRRVIVTHLYFHLNCLVLARVGQ